MNIQVSPAWTTLPKEIHVSVFKRFSFEDLKKVSRVSKGWNELAKCDQVCQELLFKLHQSAIQYMHQLNSDEFSKYLNAYPCQFVLPIVKPCEVNLAYFKTHVKDIKHSNMEECVCKLVLNAELGIPKIHIWESLSPSSLSVVVGIFIQQVGISYPKQDTYEVDVSLFVTSKTYSPTMCERKSRIITKDKYSYGITIFSRECNLNMEPFSSIDEGFSKGVEERSK